MMEGVDRKERTAADPELRSASYSRKDNRSAAGHRLWIDEETLRVVQQIFLLQTQEPPRVVVFAGIDSGNGCSRICASVAEVLAQNARRPVCLVDANFRSPILSDLFGTTNHQGLTDALLQKGPIHSFARPVDRHNLWLLSSGALAIDSPNLFSADNLRERLGELREEFDFVLIDAPPLSRYSDALVLGQHSEGVVLVLEADSTRRESASVAVAGLRAANVPILAAVLNKRTYPIPEKIYDWV
jgi:capsular exopolysaccharide synthesis family protein